MANARLGYDSASQVPFWFSPPLQHLSSSTDNLPNPPMGAEPSVNGSTVAMNPPHWQYMKSDHVLFRGNFQSSGMRLRVGTIRVPTVGFLIPSRVGLPACFRRRMRAAVTICVRKIFCPAVGALACPR